jgi:hypothetical protein
VAGCCLTTGVEGGAGGGGGALASISSRYISSWPLKKAADWAFKAAAVGGGLSCMIGATEEEEEDMDIAGGGNFPLIT